MLMVLAFIALAGFAYAQRQDETLDSLMLESSLQPVNDPIPRLLQEALESAAVKPGSYGAPTRGPIGTVTAPAAEPPKQRSSSSAAAAGLVSMAAAAAVAFFL